MQVCPKNPSNFNVDNVRVAKILGAGLSDSYVVGGMVLKLDATGTIKKAEKAKVCGSPRELGYRVLSQCGANLHLSSRHKMCEAGYPLTPEPSFPLHPSLHREPSLSPMLLPHSSDPACCRARRLLCLAAASTRRPRRQRARC